MWWLATVVPSAVPLCQSSDPATGIYGPTPCAFQVELGTQAAWYANSVLGVGIALLGALVGLGVLMAVSIYFRRV